MLTLCLILAVVSFSIALPLVWLLITAGHRLGHLDQPDRPGAGGRKLHAQPTPNTGGIAIFWTVALPMVIGLAMVWSNAAHALARLVPGLVDHVPGLRQQTGLALGVLGGAGALHLLGLIDDRLRLGPLIKLLPQVLVAMVLVLFFDMRVFEFLHTYLGAPGAALSILLSILWIVAITNAMNFMDNMDGLSAGVGAIIAALYLAANLLGGQWFVAGLSALLLGALVGFLVFNFPPARVFMGDGGSLVLGLLLAVISIRTTYFGPASPDDVLPPSPWYGLLMPLIVLAVPLYDLASVTLIRLSEGRSPLVGDRRHFSHRLVSRGLSQRGAVLAIWMFTLATGLGGVMLRTLVPWQAILVGAQVLAIVSALALVEYGTAPKPQPPMNADERGLGIDAERSSNDQPGSPSQASGPHGGALQG